MHIPEAYESSLTRTPGKHEWPGTIPNDWFLDIEPPFAERTDEGHLTFARLAFGVREDGTTQVGYLCGGNHSQDPTNVIFPHMERCWQDIAAEGDLQRLAVHVEGRVRQPDEHAPLEHIMDGLGEIGFFEYMARRAKIEDITSAEPHPDMWHQFGQKYGYDTLHYYLSARMWMQLSQIPRDRRPHISLYLMDMYRQPLYASIREAGEAAGCDMSVIGFKRTWDTLHPEHTDGLEYLFQDPRFAQLTHDETRHVPILTATRRGQKRIAEWNPVERLTVEYNQQRNMNFFRRYMDDIDAGKDVVLVAGDAHLLAVLGPLTLCAEQSSFTWGDLSYRS
jgi:hypothetical protein